MAHLQQWLIDNDAKTSGIGNPDNWRFVTTKNGGYMNYLPLAAATFRDKKMIVESNRIFSFYTKQFPMDKLTAGFAEIVLYALAVRSHQFDKFTGYFRDCIFGGPVQFIKYE